MTDETSNVPVQTCSVLLYRNEVENYLSESPTDTEERISSHPQIESSSFRQKTFAVKMNTRQKRVRSDVADEVLPCSSKSRHLTPNKGNTPAKCSSNPSKCKKPVSSPTEVVEPGTQTLELAMAFTESNAQYQRLHKIFFKLTLKNYELTLLDQKININSSNTTQPSHEDYIENKSCKCKFCFTLLPSYNALYHHFVTCHEVSVLCVKCVCAVGDEIISHLSDKHNLKFNFDVFQSVAGEFLSKTLIQKVCLYCNKFEDNIYKHVLLSHSTCRLCSASFPNKDKLCSHNNRHALGLISRYECQNCKLEFTHKTLIERHVHSCTHNATFKHNIIYPFLKIFENQEKCPYCVEDFNSSKALLEHCTKHEAKFCKRCNSNFIPLLSQDKKMNVDIQCTNCAVRYNTSEILLNAAVEPQSMVEELTKKSPQFAIEFSERSQTLKEGKHATASLSSLLSSSFNFKVLDLKHLDEQLSGMTSTRYYRCMFCNDVLLNAEQLLNHMSSSVDLNFKCEVCSWQSSSLSELNNHLSTHDYKVEDEKKLTCVLSELIYQRNKAGFLPPNQCLYCDLQCSLASYLFHHISSDHLFCRICGIAFSFIFEFFKHNEQHMLGNISNYKCQMCNLELISISLLKQHVVDHHQSTDTSFTVVPKYLVPPEYLAPFYCPYCPSNFSNESTIRYHLLHHKSKKCLNCQNIFIVSELNCVKCVVCIQKDDAEIRSVLNVTENKPTYDILISDGKNIQVSSSGTCDTPSEDIVAPSVDLIEPPRLNEELIAPVSPVTVKETDDIPNETKTLTISMGCIVSVQLERKLHRIFFNVPIHNNKVLVQGKSINLNSINTTLPLFKDYLESKTCICYSCLKLFSSFAALYQHLNCSHELKLRCVTCSCLVRDISHFRQKHSLKCNVEIFKTLFAETFNKDLFQRVCLYCKVFVDDIYNHVMSCHFTCRSCSANFINKFELITHNNRHSLGLISRFKCQNCNMEVTSKTLMGKHVKTCYTLGVLSTQKVILPLIPHFENHEKCPYCCERFASREQLLDHSTKHDVRTCQTCQSRFVPIICQVQNKVVNVECTNCAGRYNNVITKCETSIDVQVKSVSNVENFAKDSPQLGLEFSERPEKNTSDKRLCWVSISNLQTLSFTFSLTELEDILNFISLRYSATGDRRHLDCVLCKASMLTPEVVTNHIYESYFIKFKCDSCCFTCPTLYAFKRHLITRHNNNLFSYFTLQTCIGELIYLANRGNGLTHNQCLYCDQKCSLPSYLFRHISMDHLFCRICGVSFSSTKEHFEHNEQHSLGNIFSYKCQNCQIELNSLVLLKQHVVNNHQSNETVFTFTPKFLLQPEHTALYHCPYCPLTFQEKYDVLNHIRQHKSSKCSDCHKKFIVAKESCQKCAICLLKLDSADNMNGSEKHQIHYDTLTSDGTNVKFSSSNAKLAPMILSGTHTLISHKITVPARELDKNSPVQICMHFLESTNNQPHATQHTIIFEINHSIVDQFSTTQPVNKEKFCCKICKNCCDNNFLYIFNHFVSYHNAIFTCKDCLSTIPVPLCAKSLSGHLASTHLWPCEVLEDKLKYILGKLICKLFSMEFGSETSSSVPGNQIIAPTEDDEEMTNEFIKIEPTADVPVEFDFVSCETEGAFCQTEIKTEVEPNSPPTVIQQSQQNQMEFEEHIIKMEHDGDN